jgi:hypothetical protein
MLNFQATVMTQHIFGILEALGDLDCTSFGSQTSVVTPINQNLEDSLA